MNPTPRPRGVRLAMAVDLLLLAILATALGLQARAFVGFPKGYDAYGHVAKVNLVLSTFPHINWNDAWYMGVPSFQGSYPPLYHLLVALGAWISGASIAGAVVAVAAVCVLVSTFAIYGTVRAVVSSRLAGMVAAILWVASATLWTQIVRDGFYPRILALAFASLAMLAAALHDRRPSRVRFAAAAVASGAALASHVIVGLAAAVIVGALLVAAPSLSSGQRVRRGAGFVAAIVGLSAFFYLPLVFDYHGQHTFAEANPMPLINLISPGTKAAVKSPAPILVPLVLVLAALALWRSRRLEGTPQAASYAWPLRVAAICGAASLAWLAYGEGGHIGFLRRHTIYGLRPVDVMVYVAWLLSVACGVLLGAVLGDEWSCVRWRRAILVGAIPTAALLCVALIVPRLPTDAVDYDTSGVRALIRIFPAAAGDHEYRVGAGQDAITEWINAISPAPQVRGYQAQAILHLDWQRWLETALTDPNTPTPIRNFLLDWNAVRWVYAGPGSNRIAPYAAHPDDYQFLAGANKGRRPYSTYRVNVSTPVLAATSALTVLVIGDESHYSLFFRSLAPDDVNSARVIPVRGGAFVDDHSPAELERFDEVMLYGASAHDPRRAAGLLSAFVRGGGGLIVEAGDQSPLIRGLAQQGGGPIPVAGSMPTRVQGVWAFRSPPVSGSPTRGIDFSAFPPPRSPSMPWWLCATPTSIRAWASPVLLSAARPVVVTGRYGSGRVVWSGLNLPQHTTEYGNEQESALLGRMVSSVAPVPASAAQWVSSYQSPESRMVQVRSGTGVLFKENATGDWRAFVGGRAVRIYPAGPDMMFIPLRTVAEPVAVAFRYRLSLVERAGLGLTLFSLVALLLYAAGVRKQTFRHRWRRPRSGEPGRCPSS